ncbi:Tn3 family transposase [Nitrosomonas eutropha]|uniref:TnpA family transposase n=2 Tax=Nitrosomonas eutropha TaxID=916 RepID=A0ABX5M7F1_9PROT|nr:Tn3 family transposase [Nitrosomonas eutropha]ABI60737.1 transposase Tn3 family protein [Nitrosomonas eutropha C91]PXV76076.1 TnpA family transposase [Nitrosomonas eutropha]
MGDRWALTTEEQALVLTKRQANRLAYAFFLVYFREYGKFPRNTTEVDEPLIVILCKQLGWPEVDTDSVFQISDRTLERLRTEIRARFGFREATVADADMLEEWLQVNVAPNAGGEIDAMLERLHAHCKALRIEPPTQERSERIAKAALRTYEERFCAEIFAKLSDTTRAKLDSLLKPNDSNITEYDSIHTFNFAPAMLLKLCSNPGRPSLASMQEELDKLTLIRQIELPENLFGNVASSDLERYRRRVAVQEPHELRRLAEATRMTWLAAFVYLRGRGLIDDLVDTLIETIHQIGARAERKVEKELLDDLKRVSGKQNLLFEMADASLSNPDGVVRDVVFPVVGEQKLRDLVKEWKATGPAYRLTLRTVIRNSYKGHYRRMVPKMLQALAFRSNNKHHQPVMDALDLVKQYADSKVHIYPSDADVPLNGVVSDLWRDAIVEKDAKDRNRVNRVTYEIAVLEALRERLRCKEIWVVGANRYRNPDEDLPQDFEQNREEHYAALDLPQDVDQFIADLQADMREALETLNAGIIKNPYVRLNSKNSGWISLSPLEALPDPPTLTVLKTELNTMWPMTNLLDMVKEADLRLGFTYVLKSPTSYESMDRALLQRRLLLCVHGLGTNAGLQRMASLGSGTSAKDLAYVRRRYLNVDSMRSAIAMITNGTLHVRDPAIWGSDTTACASDSKHFGAWDQNLTTQWHVRYGGRGVMIYWHVERNSLCIHSQLKSPSSSEVASMIEGVIHHCTEMEVDRQYVDSHGQSTVAFAFCRLLGFQLMPRLKNIYAQKLSRPETGMPNAYENLQLILTKPINWDEIRRQYDQIVKYTTALRLATAETEAILRRFTKKNLQHPTYKALAELGKAVKTVFLCRYLHSEELRREINAGLNVIEQWNGATDFVFFARRGEMSSNRKEDHEISMLSLHLIQNCMVYINTLMIQKILAQPHWQGRMTPRDYAALTPLIWEHVNPYGRFDLDMTARLPL